MILPRNTSPSWDSEGNLIVPRYGIRIAMILALVAVSSFCLFTFLGDKQWRQHHPSSLPTRTDPFGFTVLCIARPLLPLIFSMWMLSRRSEEAKATGAGVAAGLFVCGSLAAIIAFLALSFFPDLYVTAGEESSAILGWSVTDQQPKFVPLLTEIPNDLQMAGILSLQEEIRLFMKANGGTPPATLSKMSQYSDKSEHNDTLTNRWYRLEYFPPTASAPKAYMLSAVCQSYGDACIRSFLVDQDGDIHQTSEPRQPTTQDPLIPDCEKYGQTCRDIDWPAP